MNKEIEIRFLEINKKDIIKKLNSLGAIDKGKNVLKEIIFYHKNELKGYHKKNGIIRLKSIKNKIKVLTK